MANTVANHLLLSIKDSIITPPAACVLPDPLSLLLWSQAARSSPSPTSSSFVRQQTAYLPSKNKVGPIKTNNKPTTTKQPTSKHHPSITTNIIIQLDKRSWPRSCSPPRPPSHHSHKHKIKTKRTHVLLQIIAINIKLK
jgi:hypothetical protein